MMKYLTFMLSLCVLLVPALVQADEAEADYSDIANYILADASDDDPGNTPKTCGCGILHAGTATVPCPKSCGEFDVCGVQHQGPNGPINQFYVCDSGHGPMSQEELNQYLREK